MAKFIELTTLKGRKILINLNKVVSIEETNKGVEIEANDEFYYVTESYEAIKTLIIQSGEII